MCPFQETLRDRLAQALAQKFTTPQKYIPSTERPGRYQAVPASLAERAGRAPQILPPTSGPLGIVRPTCLEIADAVAAAVETEVERRLAAVHTELDCWQATLNTGVMAGTEWERCLATNLPILRSVAEDAARSISDQDVPAAPALALTARWDGMLDNITGDGGEYVVGCVTQHGRTFDLVLSEADARALAGVLPTPARPAPADADLPARIAEVMLRHHIDPTRTDAGRNDFCVCGGWVSGEMSPGWDDHLAEVAVDALTPVLAARDARIAALEVEVERLRTRQEFATSDWCRPAGLDAVVDHFQQTHTPWPSSLVPDAPGIDPIRGDVRHYISLMAPEITRVTLEQADLQMRLDAERAQQEPAEIAEQAAEITALRAQLVATTRPEAALDRLAADARPGSTPSPETVSVHLEAVDSAGETASLGYNVMATVERHDGLDITVLTVPDGRWLLSVAPYGRGRPRTITHIRMTSQAGELALVPLPEPRRFARPGDVEVAGLRAEIPGRLAADARPGVTIYDQGGGVVATASHYAEARPDDAAPGRCPEPDCEAERGHIGWHVGDTSAWNDFGERRHIPGMPPRATDPTSQRPAAGGGR